MLGDFINRGLVMLLGYAYPAFECFKTLEKNKVDINELRFWCQYWIIIALLSVVERFGDVFISWLPLYGEMKVFFIVYLWYPKTKGTCFIYGSFIRPYVAKHETEIDRRLQELRLRAWDLGLHYVQNCSQLGQTAFIQVVQYLANQSARFKGATANPQKNAQQPQPKGPPPPPPADFMPPSPLRRSSNDLNPQPRRDNGPSSPFLRSPRSPSVNKRWPTSAPPMPSTLSRAEAQSPRSKVVQLESKDAQTEYVHVDHEEARGQGAELGPDGKPNLAGLRLRHTKPE